MKDILLKKATEKEILEEVMTRRGVQFEKGQDADNYQYRLMLIDKKTLSALKYGGQLKELERHKQNHGEEYYYKIREELNQVKLTGNNPPNIKNAGMFLYLNKAGFNGLYRENGKGLINVPYGHKKKITLFTKRNIKKISEYLRTNNIKIICQDYGEIKPKKGDFIYLDPPYDGTYNDYTTYDFSQARLKEYCDQLDEAGIK
ncbi:5721_t:CDS:2 [Cetraspora pellucida]|uniref:5721_t:CDS:1 n=1 Tax=Cetraspora pellucida TaxID=1433469 RepID=A0ACA9MFD7_9GLOM|nr:5721_t:CDS:2 [Cetraspora pellucida]